MAPFHDILPGRSAPGISGRVLAFPHAPAARRPLDPAPAASAPAIDGPTLTFSPSEISRRHAMAWRGISGESLQIVWPLPFEYEFRAPYHLLLSYERGARRAGETIIEDGPRSTVHEVGGKLTFVPAGCRLYERYVPRTLLRATAFYIDPEGPLLAGLGDGAAARFVPRLFFEDAALGESVRKLKTLVEAGGAAPPAYAEALGAVLVQELLRLNDGGRHTETSRRGGLAGWQCRLVAHYIEENLSAPIPLSVLAAIARLSPFHFARAFKRSFSMPPHRYHTLRRIERAKMLLSARSLSVTEIALDVGFGEISSFTSAFHRLVGVTPTAYRRRLI